MPYKSLILKDMLTLAGAAGIEPAIPIPKTGALPLGHAPKRQRGL